MALRPSMLFGYGPILMMFKRHARARFNVGFLLQRTGPSVEFGVR